MYCTDISHQLQMYLTDTRAVATVVAVSMYVSKSFLKSSKI